MDKHRTTRQHGFSLIELMVSMVIGLLLLVAITASYLNAQDARRTNDTLARLHEDASFTLERLARDIELAGYWGLITFEGAITGLNQAVSADCSTNWAMDLETEIEVLDNWDHAAVPGRFTGCLGAGEHRAGTDVIAIRYVDPEVATGIYPASPVGDEGKLYIRSDHSRGIMYEGHTSDNPPSENLFGSPLEDHRYRVSIFFIDPNPPPSDGMPLLRRKSLADTGTDTAIANDAEGILARGVEDLQVQLGLQDTAGLRFVDGDSTDITAGASNVIAARIWILLRSEREEPGYTDTRTYQYANRSYTPNDGFRRLLVSRTIKLRNMDQN